MRISSPARRPPCCEYSPELEDQILFGQVTRWHRELPITAVGAYRLGDFIAAMDVDSSIQFAGDYMSAADQNGAIEYRAAGRILAAAGDQPD